MATNQRESKSATFEEVMKMQIKCPECEWIGEYREITKHSAENGIDYSYYCPKCHECLESNAQYYFENI